MTSIDDTLTIAGAAEGSYYTAAGVSVDVRYRPSFAGTNSGMSFGVFQFDVATNPRGQAVFQSILQQAVAAKKIEKATSERLFKAAATRNAGAQMKPADRQIVITLLSDVSARAKIDAADRQRALSMATLIDSMIALAAKFWADKKIAGAAILTPGQPSCLRLFAYLLASLNRYPADEDPFQRWLQGGKVKTLNGPAGGFQLVAPPTIEQMHAFFQSLRIWDGTQGNYQNLRARLDPTLARIAK